MSKAWPLVIAAFQRPDIGPWLVLGASTIVSLIFVLGLYGLSRMLGLGGDVRLTGPDHARALAEATVAGFDPVTITLDRARIGALVRGRDGRVMLIRRHGARFVGRVLTSHEGVRLDRTTLTLDTEDRAFGTLTLDLGIEAQNWAASLRRLGEELPA